MGKVEKCTLDSYYIIPFPETKRQPFLRISAIHMNLISNKVSYSCRWFSKKGIM